MVDEIKAQPPVGKGFLDSKGNVKSRETLQAEDSKRPAKSDPTSSAGSISLDSALRGASSSFNEKVSSISSDISEQQSNLKEAKAIVKKEIEVAKELKVALKNNDEVTAQKSREKLDKLETKRSELSKEIEQDNKESSESIRTVSLGNKVLGSVKIDKATFNESSLSDVDLESKKDVNALIDSLSKELDGITSQLESVKNSRSDLTEIATAGKKELDSIQDSSIRSIEKAEQSAQSVAEQIRSAGSQSLVAHSISASVVQRLLS